MLATVRESRSSRDFYFLEELLEDLAILDEFGGEEDTASEGAEDDLLNDLDIFYELDPSFFDFVKG